MFVAALRSELQSLSIVYPMSLLKEECRESTAVVTTCSHIFCLKCANVLFNPQQSERTCPACCVTLPGDDDVCASSLTPSNDYKTTVLAGLPPSTVSEIAARSIAFYQYQISQEALYQKMVLKKTQDKAATLSKQYSSIVQEATAEINSIAEKLTSVTLELDQEKARVRELVEERKESARNYSKLRTHYDRLKSGQVLHKSPTISDQEAPLPKDGPVFSTPARHGFQPQSARPAPQAWAVPHPPEQHANYRSVLPKPTPQVRSRSFAAPNRLSSDHHNPSAFERAFQKI